jgi:hypothetical protein
MPILSLKWWGFPTEIFYEFPFIFHLYYMHHQYADMNTVQLNNFFNLQPASTGSETNVLILRPKTCRLVKTAIHLREQL